MNLAVHRVRQPHVALDGIDAVVQGLVRRASKRLGRIPAILLYTKHAVSLLIAHMVIKINKRTGSNEEFISSSESFAGGESPSLTDDPPPLDRRRVGGGDCAARRRLAAPAASPPGARESPTWSTRLNTSSTIENSESSNESPFDYAAPALCSKTKVCMNCTSLAPLSDPGVGCRLPSTTAIIRSPSFVIDE